jgi:two-component system chemotaxis response regulator CheB
MKTIRVVVVDDSPTVRAVVSAILRTDPGITIVGEAKNGEQAIAIVSDLKPDIVTMDLHMPVMDGLAATRAIMEAQPTPILLMTGAEDSEDVALSFEVLRAGAVALTNKPPAGGDEAKQQWARLIELVKALSDVRVVRQRPALSPPNPVPAPRAPSRDRVQVIGVGSSAGGPTAVRDFLLSLPKSVAVPVLIVQHIAPEFTEGFAHWLAGSLRGKRSVAIAKHGAKPAGDGVYVAPADQHLGLSSAGALLLSEAPAIGGFRPSASFLFDSIAKRHGAAAIGVTLSGMGTDGIEGSHVLRAAGGVIIAQDRESALVFGMPGAVADAGLADIMLEPGAMGGYIAGIVERSRPA